MLAELQLCLAATKTQGEPILSRLKRLIMLSCLELQNSQMCSTARCVAQKIFPLCIICCKKLDLKNLEKFLFIDVPCSTIPFIYVSNNLCSVTHTQVSRENQDVIEQILFSCKYLCQSVIHLQACIVQPQFPKKKYNAV